jgi:glycine betaine/proline transport system substrate-binding protein
MKLQRNIFTTAAAALVVTAGMATVRPLFVTAQEDLPGSGTSVTPAYGVLGERFQTEIVSIGLERLGYEVEESKELEYATMHVAVANGDVHFSPAHWETLHNDFFSESGGEEAMTRLGVVVPNNLQGYLIDKTTMEENNITSIDQLQDPEVAAIFDGDGDGKADLTGCNPGWGCELVIEHHLDAYALRDTVEHDQGKYDALIANTITRYEQGEPILYYTWTPYWVGGVLVPGEDVEWLSVPYTDLPEAQGEVSEEDTTANGKNLGFAVDRQMVVANNTFLADNPAAAEFFKMVTIPINDVSAQNLLLQEGEDSEEDIRRHAEEWVTENEEQFSSWVEAAKQAG